MQSVRSRYANWVRELATLIDAGLPLQDAVSKLTGHFAEDENASLTRQLQAGQPLHVALSYTKILSTYQREVIRLGERAGKLSSALKWLANDLERSEALRKKVNGKLLYPFFVFLIALLVSSVLAFVKLPLDAAMGKLFGNLIVLVFIYVITRKIMAVLFKRSEFWLPLFWRYRGMREISILQKMYEQEWLKWLHWQMEAGLDIASACQNMSRFYSAKAYQKSVSDAVKAVNAGESISAVLQRVNLLFTHGMKQMVLSAEKSGEWARSVEIVRAGYEDDVERFYDSLTEWLPRFFYLLVIGIGFSVLM